MSGELRVREDFYRERCVMRGISIQGKFRLKPGIRLIAGNEGGVVLRETPLRALKVNGAAFRLLERCAHGVSLNNSGIIHSDKQTESLLAVLDRFCQAGLLEWEPPADLSYPFVSIIIPVYNRENDIGECLQSLLALDYPSEKREIIVVDDCSEDDTRSVVRGYQARLLVLSENSGPSAARNAGVAAARGDIAAFVDSDCIADPAWLRDLVPYFCDSRNVLVGGYVDSYYTESRMDRYEESNSPLCMGKELVIGYGEKSDFYVPTCNMLVRKEAYLLVGGLNEKQRVGEDVDLCWKLKERGARLLYVPKGRVKHKHRNRFFETFSRRFAYGTSEALLHAAHEQAGKRYPWNSASMGILVACLLALIAREPLILCLVPLIAVGDAVVKKRRYDEKVGVAITFQTRSEGHAGHSFSAPPPVDLYHAVRYYVLPMLVLAAIFQPFVAVAVAAIVFASLVEYLRKMPRLNYLEFLFFFLMEHMWYQAGALWGSIRRKSFKNYRLMFVTSRSGKS